jgi:hypothetical protein
MFPDAFRPHVASKASRAALTAISTSFGVASEILVITAPLAEHVECQQNLVNTKHALTRVDDAVWHPRQ